ncbi:MAG: PAS domain S-box protein [Anaerolineae bacterium]
MVLQDETRYYEAHLVNTLLDEILCTLRDITVRKQAEEALRTSEQRLRQIIEYSADGVALADQSGRLIEWNPAIEQSSGLTRQAVVGRPIWEVQFGLQPGRTRDAGHVGTG